MLSSKHQVGARLDGLAGPGRACRTRPRRAARGRPHADRREGRPPRRLRPATWLSLISAASDSDIRWLTPPPHRTAYFSSARRPGVVLRVSRIAAPVPSTASTQRRVKRGNARQVSQQIQRGALGGEQRSGRSGRGQQHGAGGYPRRRRRPVRRRAPSRRSPSPEHDRDDRQPRDHARCPRDEVGRRLLISWDRQRRS